MAPPDKSLSQKDAKPANSGRRVVRIPFPPKNKFWKLMVEKGWAIEADGLRKDKSKLPAEPIIAPKPKSAEKKPEVRKITTADVSSLFEEGKADELVALAGQGPETLGLVVHGAIEFLTLTSEAEKQMAKGNCVYLVERLHPEDYPPDSEERDNLVFEVLRRIGEPALAHLKNYLLSETADMARSSKLAQFLAMSGSPRHVRLLIEIYDKDVSNYFLSALEHPSPTIQEELVKALERNQHSQHSEVAFLGVLARLGNPAMLDNYLRYLDTHCEFADELIRHLITFGEASVPVLSDYLGSKGPTFSNKIHALYALEQIASPVSLTAAFDLIDRGNYESAEWNEAVSAIKKVVLAVGPMAVPHIHVRMGDTPKDSPRTCAYLEYLGALKCDESVYSLTHLVSVSQGTSPTAVYVREMIVEALGETGRISAFEPLRGLLADKHFHVAQSSAKAIEAMSRTATLDKKEKAYSCLLRGAPEEVDYGDGEVYGYLVSSTRHKFPAVRATALAALGLSGKPDAVSILISSLKDKYPEARAAAATALRNNREEGAIRPLIETLGDEDEGVSKAAEHAILDYHKAMNTQDNDKDIVSEHILIGMRHKNKRVRHMSIKLMAEIGASTAIPALKRLALEDPEPKVRLKALKVLGNYASQNVNTYVEALGDSKSEVYEIAIAQLQILEGVGEHALTAALKSNKRPEVRMRAALALARSGNPHFIDNLKNALNDPSKDVRTAAITNMGELTVKLLNMPLERFDEETRDRIRSAHVENAIIPLLKLFEDSDPDIQAEAATAIARIVKVSDTEIVGVDAVPHLVGLLRHRIQYARDNAVNLLNRILETCDTEEEVQEYLALVEKSLKEMRGFWGRAQDKFSRKNAEATEMAREICEEFVRLAQEKEHKFENGHDGPYR